jgi:gliding motility-associated-like protein
MSRFHPIACFLVLLILTNGKTFGNIVLTTTVTNVSTEIFDYGNQLIYNGAIQATASGGTAPYTYTLLLPSGNPVSQQNGYFPVLSAGTYPLSVTDAGGQTTSTPVTVSFQYPQPTVTASNIVVPACAATGSFTLTGSGGTPPYLYSIDGGTSFTAQYSFTNLAQGDYVILIKDANGQVGMIGKNPTSKILPGFIGLFGTSCDIAQGAQFSSATCANLGHLHVSIFSDRTQNSFSLDGVHYIPLILNPAFPALYQYDSSGLAPGLYDFYLKDDISELSVYASVIIKYCTLYLSFTATSASCGQNDGTLQVKVIDGVQPYSYTMDGLHYQPGNQFSGLSPGNYAVTVRDANGLTSSATGIVYSTCPPVITARTATINATCGNSNGIIDVNAAGGSPPYTYSLNGVFFQSADSFTHIGQGHYTVTIKDINGSIDTVSAIVGNTAGALLYSATVTASCTSDNGGINLLGYGGTPPYQYSLDGAPYQASASFAELAPAQYTAVLKDSNGCLVSQVIAVPLDNTVVVDAGPDTTVCQGTTVPLHATSNGATFSWSPVLSLDNAAVLDPKASPDTTTIYAITASYGICRQTDSVTVIVIPAPVPDAGPGDSVCFEKSAQLHGGGGQFYHWSPPNFLSDPGIPDPVVRDPDNSITYHLVVTDRKGCRSVQDATVTIQVTPPAQVFAGNDTSLLVDQPLALHAIDVNNSGFTQYQWSPTVGLDNPASPDPVAMLQESTTYTVLASTPGGCEGTATVSIKVFTASDLYVPSAFTPNGDGHNDILRVIPIGIKEFKYFAVYNRSGQRVFFTSNPSVGWDGTLNGKAQTAGAFVWITGGINFKGEAVERKGTVILVR